MEAPMPEICFRINAPAVIHEKFDDELVAINLDTGVYHSLSSAAADAFQLLTEEATQTEVAEALATKYAATPEAIHAALTPFFEQLRKEDLICQVDVQKASRPLATGWRRICFTPGGSNARSVSRLTESLPSRPGA